MRRLGFWTLLLALLLSVAGNVILYRTAKTFYTREAKFRLNPVGTPSFATSGNNSAPVLLLLGDSRCAQWPPRDTMDFQVANGGVGNETTAQILWRTKAALEKIKPAVVVIQAGINDLKAIPLLPDRQTEITDRCVSNLTAIADACHQHGAKVIMLSILPAGPVELSRRLVWSDAVAEATGAVNERLAEHFKVHSEARFLDLTHQVSANADYIDTLHFNAAFYERITPQVTQAAKEALAQAK